MQTNRPIEIKNLYITHIDRHLDELIAGKVADMYEIEDFAALMYIHPTHLSNTIKEAAGISPCGIYQMKILDRAKELLAHSTSSIHQIALLLTFDPSQFTKWFKRFAGTTPKQYRLQSRNT